MDAAIEAAIAERNRILAIKPTDEEKDVLYDLFEQWKGYDDDRMDIDEFKIFMEEYGVVANGNDGLCSPDNCDRCVMKNGTEVDQSGGWCRHYNAPGADVGGVDGLTAIQFMAALELVKFDDE